MFLLKKAGCRIVQTVFRAALPILPYREPEIVQSCWELDRVFQREQIQSVCVVTDRGIAQSGLLFLVEQVLKENKMSYVVYDRTHPNPTVSDVEEAFQLYQEHNCNALIAIGGGSAMDCAKGLGARIAYPKKKIRQMKGVLRILRKLPVLIAIPTTAGTGSETTLAAVITDSEKEQKYVLMSFPLIPRYAVLDANFTYSLPPHLTAATGMDALTHVVEAYIGRSTTKETRRWALETVKLIFENLEEAYLDGSNQKARENMLHAAYKAGLVFSRSYVGYIHAIAHSLGGKYGTHHGLANAVIMPYVLEGYGTCIDRKLWELAMAAGVCLESDTYHAGAKKFIRAVRQFNAKMGLPEKLSGICRADIPELAKHAEKEANPLYPVPKLMTQKKLEAFYRQIADGSMEA